MHAGIMLCRLVLVLNGLSDINFLKRFRTLRFEVNPDTGSLEGECLLRYFYAHAETSDE